MDRNELIQQLKEQIIKQLNLADKTPADIKDNDPLFVEGLGLDSIDALELIVLLQQEYNIKLKNAEEGQSIFRSVATMADYILEQQAGAAN
ncbi:MAG: phosphopantetheine-binding protein [Niabella sp.]